MFGYVTPCKMELKMKDYEKFKAYYCGLCKAIKTNFGNLPRLSLNYDMTFLAVLLDSLNPNSSSFKREACISHPIKKRLVIINNEALNYAAYCNVTLTYFKLLDNVNDDSSILSKLYSSVLNSYMKKSPVNFAKHTKQIDTCLNELYTMEKNPEANSLDELSHPFAHLTGYILESYIEDTACSQILYNLGYNLGKWIYIIDAWDDLEKDISKNKFNAINSIFNSKGLAYQELYDELYQRIDFILTSCGAQCSKYLEQLPLIKNKDILYNILNFGLMEKMDKVFKRSDCNNEKSI